MTAPEWERIKALFDAALDIPREERAVWLEGACAGNPDLRATIEQLLRNYDESPSADAREIPTEPVFSPGQTVANRFTVLRLIDRGGMGEVYEVQDTKLNGLRVALKTIRPEVASQRKAYDRFKREVWVAREVTHDGICRIFDLVEHREATPDGTEKIIPCLTMQLLEGETLASALLERRPFAPAEALPLIEQIVQSLEVMHAKGIAHRDLKPSNVMLVNRKGEDGKRAILMDFGLAKPLHQGPALWETRAEERAGAPYFIAPEVLRGEKGGTAVDVYALGLLIDEMVTKSPAFPNDSLEELFLKKLHADPVAPGERGENLPAGWAATIVQCLSRDPQQRPAGPAEVLRGLRGATEFAPRLPQAKATSRGLGRWRSIVERQGAITRRVARFWWVALMVGIVLLPGLAGVMGENRGPLDTSIAVYPFENLTNQDEYDYLCTGTRDEMMRRLLYVEGLQVIPLRGGTAGRFAPKVTARFSVEGKLLEHNGGVQLSVQVMDNEEHVEVWAERFERELSQPLALESEIAENVVEAMRWKAMPGQPVAARLLRRWIGLGGSLLPGQATANNDAFEEYLKGRTLWQKRTVGATETAIAHFERAVALDDRFALAYSALADAQHTLLTYSRGEPKQLLEQAQRYAAKALSLDASLPEVHVSWAAVRQMMWDWPEADAAYRRAIEAQPKFARAYQWHGGLLLQFGRFDEALALAKRGLELDPYDYPSASAYGFSLWHAGRLREAAAHLERLLEANDLLYAHAVLGQVYAGLALSNPEPEATTFYVNSLREAGIVHTRELEAAGGTDKDGFLKWSDLMFAQAHAARRDHASAMIYAGRLERGLEAGKLPAAAVAWAQAAAGNYERALQLLEIGVERREREMLYIKVAPLLQPLQRYPRFQAILRQMNL